MRSLLRLFGKKEYDTVSAALLEKSIGMDALWKSADNTFSASPLIFTKKKGSEDFSVAFNSYESLGPLELEAAAEDMEKGYYDKMKPLGKVITPMQRSLGQKNFAEQLPGGRRYDFEDFMKGDDQDLIRKGEYCYLFMNNWSPYHGNSLATLYFSLIKLNKESGFGHAPLFFNFRRKGGDIAEISGFRAKKAAEFHYVPSGGEQPEPSGAFSALRLQPGTLYVPDLKPFEGKAEVL
jgi:hypothetical protein